MDPRGEIERGREGFTRDTNATFWKEVSDCYLIREEERVHYARHDPSICRLSGKLLG